MHEEKHRQEMLKAKRSAILYWLGVRFMNDNWLVLSMDDGVVAECCLGES